jgi:hypothetical protein
MSRRNEVLSTHPPQETEKGNTTEDEEHFSDAQKLTQGREGFDLKMQRGVNRWRAKTRFPGAAAWFYLEESLGGHDATDKTAQLRPEIQ